MADTNWVVVGESEVVWGTNVVDDEENTCACVSQCDGCTARSDNDCDHFISRSWYNQNVP